MRAWTSLIAAGVMVLTSPRAEADAGLSLGLETTRLELRYARSDFSVPGSPRVTDEQVAHAGIQWLAGAEVSSPIWGGFSAGLQAGMPLGSVSTEFDLTETERSSTMWVNPHTGDTMTVDVMTFPLFFRIGWRRDFGGHRIGAGAGVGAVIVAAATVTHDQHWTDGTSSNPDPNAFPVPANRSAGGVSHTHRTDVAVLRAIRFAVDYGYAVTEKVFVGLEASITPAPVTAISGTTDAPVVYNQDVGLAFGGTSYGLALCLTSAL